MNEIRVSAKIKGGLVVRILRRALIEEVSRKVVCGGKLLLLSCVLSAFLSACASIANAPFTPNNSDVYLLSDIKAFSVVNPQPDTDARKWYFGPYYSIIPDLQSYTGFYESKGDLLSAHMLVGADASKGTVIMIHGYNGSPLFTHYQYLAQQSIASGYRVILLDLPGHAFSGGKRGTISNFTNYGAMVIDFLSHVDGTLGKKIMLVGFSTGAIAIYDAYVANEKIMDQVDASILLSPFSDLKNSEWLFIGANVMEKGVYVQDKVEPLALEQLPATWIKAQRAWTKNIASYPIINKQNILLVFGNDDNTIKHQLSLDYYSKHLPNADRLNYPAQNHTLTNDGFKQIRADLFEWMLANLEQVQ